jgi:hypothetical protein
MELVLAFRWAVIKLADAIGPCVYIEIIPNDNNPSVVPSFLVTPGDL